MEKEKKETISEGRRGAHESYRLAVGDIILKSAAADTIRKSWRLVDAGAERLQQPRRRCQPRQAAQLLVHAPFDADVLAVDRIQLCPKRRAHRCVAARGGRTAVFKAGHGGSRLLQHGAALRGKLVEVAANDCDVGERPVGGWRGWGAAGSGRLRGRLLLLLRQRLPRRAAASGRHERRDAESAVEDGRRDQRGGRGDACSEAEDEPTEMHAGLSSLLVLNGFVAVLEKKRPLEMGGGAGGQGQVFQTCCGRNGWAEGGAKDGLAKVGWIVGEPVRLNTQLGHAHCVGFAHVIRDEVMA